MKGEFEQVGRAVATPTAFYPSTTRRAWIPSGLRDLREQKYLACRLLLQYCRRGSSGNFRYFLFDTASGFRILPAVAPGYVRIF
jgi:hypothetical protein